ncbi:hypothetical protein [Vibrio alginolyticus]|uniref:hypothetical protein n=1 Tax=Vibrio alginolyticus TaxID=663 RepID=UPI001E64F28B|nr:hypothetical protein [Vibrio alginolyticus]
MKQIAQLDFTCSDSDVRTLRDSRFYNRYIRFYCDDHRRREKRVPRLVVKCLAHLVVNDFRWMRTFSASLILPATEMDQIEWMVIYDNEHVEVFWVLDNSWVNDG